MWLKHVLSAVFTLRNTVQKDRILMTVVYIVDESIVYLN
jgi:hypothetical protein